MSLRNVRLVFGQLAILAGMREAYQKSLFLCQESKMPRASYLDGGPQYRCCHNLDVFEGSAWGTTDRKSMEKEMYASSSDKTEAKIWDMTTASGKSGPVAVHRIAYDNGYGGVTCNYPSCARELHCAAPALQPEVTGQYLKIAARLLEPP